MIRPSPNELDRLKNEEIARRRLVRLKEVREHSKQNASKLRSLYKEQKLKVLNKIAHSIQEQFNAEDEKKLNNLKLKHSNQINSIGHGHDNASDWVDPVILLNEQLEIDHSVALQRHQNALNVLHKNRKQKQYIETARLKAMQLALIVEKERAAEIAALPPVDIPEYLRDLEINSGDAIPKVKVCDKNKFSVIESFENAVYNVERVNETNDAKIAAEIRQEQLTKMNCDLQVQSEEQSIKAHLRGHKALKKQLVHKDYQELISDLEHVAKSEMAKRQREYHKNEMIGPNSAGHMGVGHNIAMMIYKEKCRERAIEVAVMESLKDITNSTHKNQPDSMNESFLPENSVPIQPSSIESATKLTRLYEKIRQQKENEENENQFSNVTENSSVTKGSQIRHNVTSELENNLESSDLIITDLSQNIIEPDSVLRTALSATDRCAAILEESNRLKLRKNLEDDIQAIDRRMTDLTGNVCSRPVLSPTQSHSTVQSKTIDRITNLNNWSEISSSTEKISVVTGDSESVSKIREFQRKALMKLNGQLNLSQLYALENQISNFSIDSNSVSSQSLEKSLLSYQHPQTENGDTKSDSLSVVNAWVTSQVLETIEKLPEWVTRPQEQLLSDFNPVSLKSSVSSMGLIDSSAKTNLSDSSTTIGSCISLSNIKVQPSLTEISAMKNCSRSDRSLNISETTVSDHHGNVMLSKENVSVISTSSMELNKSKLQIDNTDFNSSNGGLDRESIVSSIRRSVEDLIDFRSTDHLNQFSLISEPTIQNHQPEPVEMTPGSFLDDSTCTLKPLSISISGSLESDELRSPSLISDVSDQPTIKLLSVDSGDMVPNSCESLIKEYENFLSNIIQESEGVKSIDASRSNQNTSQDCAGTLISTFGKSTNNFDTHDDESTNKDHGTEHILSVESPVQNVSTSKYDSSDEQKSEIILSTEKDYESRGNEDGDISNTPGSFFYPGSNLNLSSVRQAVLNDNIESIDSSGSMKPLSEFHESHKEVTLDHQDNLLSPPCDPDNNEIWAGNKRDILSSTMLPKKINVLPSPDVSSIYSDSSSLKQRIMLEYFEKNKDYLLAALSSTKTTDLTLKPLDSPDDTPRNLDSGKASSRLTTERSGESTARLTNEDIFVTPRNDSCWTEYTSRDEWSSSRSNFQPLSEYLSDNPENHIVELDPAMSASFDLDSDCQEKTLQNVEVDGDVDLILFTSSDRINKMADSNSGGADFMGTDIFSSDCERPSIPTNQQLSINSSNNQLIESKQFEESFLSDKSSTQCESSSSPSSYKILQSFHSSTDSCLDYVAPIPAQEPKIHSCAISTKQNISSIDSRSELDISNQSLASFLRNESICQKAFLDNSESVRGSTPKPAAAASMSIDNNEDMKVQLEKWKKERLLKVNKNPPKDSNSQQLIKDGNARHKDDVDIKSRTLKLWNKLEEVQKLKQAKAVEQQKIDNHKKKKEYSEKLRRMKMEKQKKIDK